MRTTEKITLLAVFFALVGLGVWFFMVVAGEEAELRDAVARGDFEIRETDQTQPPSDQEPWRTMFPQTVAITIGGVAVEASVADSLPERIKGLSNTPYLPENVVKLFAFGVPGSHSIWMKDMNYALDILWVSEDGTIVHIEENISPDTFPTSFSSSKPAWFVIEANAGFVALHDIVIGDEVVLPIVQTAVTQ